MTKRTAGYPIDNLFLDRYSPRALSGESISYDQLMSLFEAARWAPSSYNNQPWRFIYAMRNTAPWPILLDLLIDANKFWAKNAAVLIVIISHKLFEFNNKPSRTHSFDTGAAWENLALQATKMGLVAHGMEGFDYEEAETILQIPEEFQIEAMVAVGKHGDKNELPEELQKREEPNGRKPLGKLIFEGIYKAD